MTVLVDIRHRYVSDMEDDMTVPVTRTNYAPEELRGETMR